MDWVSSVCIGSLIIVIMRRSASRTKDKMAVGVEFGQGDEHDFALGILLQPGLEQVNLAPHNLFLLGRVTKDCKGEIVVAVMLHRRRL